MAAGIETVPVVCGAGKTAKTGKWNRRRLGYKNVVGLSGLDEGNAGSSG
jgi:hypothetical protein